MRHVVLMVALGVAGIAACATGSGDPAAMAATQCGHFARSEGARLVGVQGVEPVSDGDANFKVRMSIEDALQRKMSMACLYSSAGNKTRWESPLPSGFFRL